MHWQYRPFPITAATTVPTAIGNNVATTSSTSITAGNNVVVTPASMQNIVVGRWLNFNGGTGSPEDVQVLSVNVGAGTFTANFQNNHSGAYVISSQQTVDIGEFDVNDAGDNVTVTLYDGHPNAWVPGVAFAVIVPRAGDNARIFKTRLNRGLFYTCTGTLGNYTVTYHDRSA